MILKIKRFKDWYQVVNQCGFAIDQFLSHKEAEDYIFVQTHNRGLGVAMQSVNQRRGYTMLRISKYP